MGRAEKQGRFGVHADTVRRASHQRLCHGMDHLTDGPVAAGGVQKIAIAFRTNQVPAGDKKPQGSVRGVAISSIAAPNHVGDGAGLFKSAELDEDLTGIIPAASRD